MSLSTQSKQERLIGEARTVHETFPSSPNGVNSDPSRGRGPSNRSLDSLPEGGIPLCLKYPSPMVQHPSSNRARMGSPPYLGRRRALRPRNDESSFHTVFHGIAAALGGNSRSRKTHAGCCGSSISNGASLRASARGLWPSPN